MNMRNFAQYLRNILNQQNSTLKAVKVVLPLLTQPQELKMLKDPIFP